MMKKRIFAGIAGVLLLLIFVLKCPRPAGPLLGDWKGTVDFGNYKLRLLFHVEKGPDGRIKAALFSPDQGAKDIPVDSVFLGLFTGQAKFHIPSIHGHYA